MFFVSSEGSGANSGAGNLSEGHLHAGGAGAAQEAPRHQKLPHHGQIFQRHRQHRQVSLRSFTPVFNCSVADLNPLGSGSRSSHLKTLKWSLFILFHFIRQQFLHTSKLPCEIQQNIKNM